MEKFNITRVVTKNVVTDSFQWIRNLFGLRLRGYEGMVQKAITEITQEAEIKYYIKWYKYIVNPLGKGSVIVIMYGEGELK